jgi:hypothetical protein
MRDTERKRRTKLGQGNRVGPVEDTTTYRANKKESVFFFWSSTAIIPGGIPPQVAHVEYEDMLFILIWV